VFHEYVLKAETCLYAEPIASVLARGPRQDGVQPGPINQPSPTKYGYRYIAPPGWPGRMLLCNLRNWRPKTLLKKPWTADTPLRGRLD